MKSIRMDLEDDDWAAWKLLAVKRRVTMKDTFLLALRNELKRQHDIENETTARVAKRDTDPSPPRHEED